VLCRLSWALRMRGREVGWDLCQDTEFVSALSKPSTFSFGMLERFCLLGSVGTVHVGCSYALSDGNTTPH
jgi:hypothetical protein